MVIIKIGDNQAFHGDNLDYLFMEIFLIGDNQAFHCDNLDYRGDNQAFHYVSPNFSDSADGLPDQTVNRIKI